MRIHVLLGMLLLCAHHAAAQATEQPTRLVGGIERREMIATQMDADGAIRLDGVLDE
jgi:hypothetical protein